MNSLLKEEQDLKNLGPIVEVTAAIIMEGKKIFIAQRPYGKKFGGRWELPGGKLEIGESGEECIIRELKEELGIEVKEAEHFLTVEHSYPNFSVKLFSYIIKEWKGKIDLKEHQAMKWVSIDEAMESDILEADLPILEKLFRSIS